MTARCFFVTHLIILKYFRFHGGYYCWCYCRRGCTYDTGSRDHHCAAPEGIAKEKRYGHLITIMAIKWIVRCIICDPHKKESTISRCLAGYLTVYHCETNLPSLLAFTFTFCSSVNALLCEDGTNGYFWSVACRSYYL